jgi:hypothetical protein
MAGVHKRLLRPERLRRVPQQFSWVDQALVRSRLIDRLDARAAALYLFLVTVADAQGLSYWGAATLGRRLGLSAGELEAARARLVELELLAWQAPLYQVLALPQQGVPSPGAAPTATPTPTPTPAVAVAVAPPMNSPPALAATPSNSSLPSARADHAQRIGDLLAQLEQRRRDRP